jgi:TolB-like protein
MSQFAFKDDETRNRLAAKGDPVRAENGGVVMLETASLKVEARIVDMTYGEAALPAESFFERITIELRAFPHRGATQRM